jgi:hypothetical protein
MAGENRAFLSYFGRTSKLEAIRLLCHNGLYVQSRDCTSAPTLFRENLIFSSLSVYSLTPKANKGYLRPPNTYRNFHAKKQRQA